MSLHTARTAHMNADTYLPMLLSSTTLYSVLTFKLFIHCLFSLFIAKSLFLSSTLAAMQTRAKFPICEHTSPIKLIPILILICGILIIHARSA